MVATAPREPVMEISVNWAGDGAFDGAYDDLSSRLIQGTLSTRRGRDSARPLGRAMAGTVSWSALNDDRLLSPEWARSPIYQLVQPGKPLRARAQAGASVAYDDPVGYNAPIFYDGLATFGLLEGQLDEPTYTTGMGNVIVPLTGLGVLSRLRDGARISTPLYTNLRTDQALTIILDAIGWPATDRVIALSDSTLSFWWLADQDPFDAIDELLWTEGAPAYFGEDGEGRAVWENRNFRSTQARSTTTQATFSDRISGNVAYDDAIPYDAHVFYDGSFQLLHGIVDYVPGYKAIYNQATATIRRRAQQTLQKVWEYGTTLTLTAGESRLITVPLSDPCDTATAPASGTDYTVSAGSLASTPTLENVNAQSVGIRWIAGPGGATILGVTSNGPQLRARPYPVLSEERVTNSVDASASIAKLGGSPRGIRNVDLPARAEISRPMAIAICDAAVSYSMVPRPTVTVRIENIDGEHLRQQLTREVSDRIAIISEYLGLAGDMWIEQIEQQRQPGKLVTTFVCERVLDETAAAIWDGPNIPANQWGFGIWGR
jgi:hypothetical protein